MEIITLELFELANAAMEKSHSPYSHFPVGAAILSSDGKTYSGTNVENVSFPVGVCAETSAISQMVLGGSKLICEILVVAEKMEMVFPCGACRQRIVEFADENTKIHICDKNGVTKTLSVNELLPFSFKADL